MNKQIKIFLSILKVSSSSTKKQADIQIPQIYKQLAIILNISKETDLPQDMWKNVNISITSRKFGKMKIKFFFMLFQNNSYMLCTAI